MIKAFFIFVVTILLIGLIAALPAFGVMLLWNWLVPMFWAGAPILTFWMALGILVLLGLLRGSQTVYLKKN